MVLRLLEEKKPLDRILFCDTGIEFPQMYEHIAKLEQALPVPIIRLKPEKSFEYYLLEYTPKRRDANHPLAGNRGLGWADARMRWCTSILKTRLIDRYLKEMRKEYEIVQYIGIAADEEKRIKDKCYPLVEWGMTEKDCLDYCYARGYDWGGLYRLFKRVSCWCCPLQPLAELRVLRKAYPELWNQLLAWQEKTWRKFKSSYSVQELDVRFQFEDERLREGKAIKGKEFFMELRKKLSEEADSMEKENKVEKR
ncbi:MAG: phosphoadenosine phosphosulfate reductase family protein [Clostridium sp.]|nr:phosphoadenosine phosphosulfate reductase family protein [Clostridium sp.]